ncbi:DNA-directed RNA polymerase [Lithospermum erythrorhizon]|uniref:DNA-directed RNA polymerase n=1 Tax=Lithospermum erythrorhizon TaxID=34254 RepID=A0AAV3PDJ3_LITER
MEVNGASECKSDSVDNGSSESHKYYLSRKTILEMLKDRGYAVPSSDIQMSLKDFRDKYGPKPDSDALKISALHKNNPSDRILVIFLGQHMVKVNSVRVIAAQIMNKETLNRLILIVENKMTSQAQKALLAFSFKVETFNILDLLVNITKHALKPKHRVLTDKEKQALLKKFDVEEKQLPRMLQNDAISRYYGLEKGQVLEVTYNGEVTGLHVTYRCVW